MDIQSKDLVLVLLGVLLGLPPAIIISRHYFKRSFLKSLTPYLMFHASPMSGMSPLVRNQMSIEFKSRRVENLIEAQFVIINDGDKALRDAIQPLTLTWPAQLRILDAEVVRRYPATLKVEPELDPLTAKKLQIHFDLLNTREWFIVKVIADGPATADQWQWSIVADELPRSLELKKLTLEDLSDLPVPSRERLIYSALTLLAGVATYGVFSSMSFLSKWEKSNMPDSSFVSAAIGILGVVLLVLGIALIGFTGGFASRAVRGLRVLRRTLPNLPDDIVADVWRGYSAQADAVERLRKANTK